jgi:hypothetical protein
MVDQINKYLNQPVAERDYQEGLKLFAQVSKNRYLINRLHRKIFPEKLFYVLGKHVNRNTIAEDAVKPVVVAKTISQSVTSTGSLTGEYSDPGKLRIITGGRKIHVDDLPAELKEKWTKNAAMYKEARSLHEKLKLLQEAPDKTRQPIIARLDQLRQAIRLNWNTIDDYDPALTSSASAATGTEHVEVPSSTFKMVSSNRAYISRNLANYEKKQSPKIGEELKRRVKELTDVGATISNDQMARLKQLGLV